ncbi:MAG: DUF134 domain-containing protein [Patescibacteria group bacterium]|nr:DUF134 domain-containing protein [Patescibacteria group bacterium]
MPRPRLCRRIRFRPRVTYFKPLGVPMVNLEVVCITHEEIESYRLRYIHKLDQNEASKKMDTSQSTYQRILTSASEKIADALVNGKALEIVN